MIRSKSGCILKCSLEVKYSPHRRALKQLRGFVAKVSKLTKILPIYKKQIEIANLSILFNRHRLSTSTADENADSTDAPQNTRVEHLASYVVSNYKLVSCFDDIKPFLEELSFDEIKLLLQHIGVDGGKVRNTVNFCLEEVC